MSIEEKLEVSIFKDIEHEKTMIAAVMDPNIPNGVGPMLIRLVPKIKTMLDNLRYTGRVRILRSVEDPNGEQEEEVDTPSYLTATSHDLTFANDVVVFGGTAYHLHKINDNSPFSHILPGVHDVDVNVKLRVDGFPSVDDGTPEDPLNVTSVNRLVEGLDNESGHAVSIFDHPDSILSFVLRNMVSTIRDHIIEETQPPRRIARDYDLSVNGNTNKIRLNPPFMFDQGADDFLYSEVVANFFRIKIAFDGGMLKTQVEIKARDSRKGISGIDHAFEAIMIVPKDNPNWKSPLSTQNIRGIDVYTKKQLFGDNLASLIDRAAANADVKLDMHTRRQFAGKCAQDFLRVVYVLLDGLQEDKPRWVETKSMTRMFGVRAGADTRDEMMKELGMLGTPIEVFMFLSGYVEPCIKASRIQHMDVFKNEDEIKRTRTVGRDFKEIIDEFKKGFPPGKDLLEEKKKLELMMVARHEKLRGESRKAGSKIVAMMKGSEKKGELGYYFNRDSDITMYIETYDEATDEESSWDVRFLRQDGVLKVSSPSYSGGAVLAVASHGDLNDNWYKVVLEDGFEMTFEKHEFINAFKQKYPEVPEPVFDEAVWYKHWLKKRA